MMNDSSYIIIFIIILSLLLLLLSLLSFIIYIIINVVICNQLSALTSRLGTADSSLTDSFVVVVNCTSNYFTVNCNLKAI